MKHSGGAPVLPWSKVLVRWSLLFLVAAWAGLAGCAEETGALPDGGPDGSVDGGDARQVTAPDIPWLEDGAPPVMLGPCPAGWREVDRGAPVECDPYPEGGPETCDAGEAHFPGEPACRPIGDPCPAGDYAADLPGGGSTLYVNAVAALGGDGTLAAPFARLSEVPWASLPASSTVALAKGSYEGTLPLKAGVHVIGACVGETVLAGIAAPVQSVVRVTSAGEPALLQNLTIRGAPQRGVQVEGGRALSLDGVLIEGVRGIGVYALDAGTEVRLGDVVIRGTKASGAVPGESGVGVHVDVSARLEAARVIASGNRGVGVSAANGGAVTLTDAVVRGTQPRAVDLRAGRGVNVDFGAHFDAARVLVSGNHDVGVFVGAAGSALTLTDVVIRDTQPRASDGTSGRGLSVQAGASLLATRLQVVGNHGSGVFMSGEGTSGTVSDAVIRDTAPERAGDLSRRGVNVGRGASLTVTRIVISEATEIGLFVAGPGTRVSAVDVLIQHTGTPSGSIERERGVAVETGGHLELSRALIADSRNMGIFAAGEGAVIDLSDVVVRDTQSRASDLRYGRALQGEFGAHIEGLRLVLDKSVGGGIFAVVDAVVMLTDVAVGDVFASDCAAASCVDAPFGYGVAAFSAAVSLSRFEITNANVCGVMVAPVVGRSEEASLDLNTGLVTGAQIGACVQAEGYDFGRLTHDVAYRDNGTNLDTTSLPVPRPVESFGP